MVYAAYAATIDSTRLLALVLLVILIYGKEVNTMSYVSLKDILGTETEALTALRNGEFTAVKLGTIPYTAIDHTEYKEIKKECMKMVPDGTGGMVPEIDDDKMMIKIVVAAVDKDQRSDFTFLSKDLLKKLGVVSAEAAVTKLLEPGEIYNLAVDIQNISGFGQKAKQEVKDTIKNS